MNKNDIFSTIRESIDMLTQHGPEKLGAVWDELLEIHPADIADFISDMIQADATIIFQALPSTLQEEVFAELSDTVKAQLLSLVDDTQAIAMLNALPPDELTDLFDVLSDEELKKNLKRLHRVQRQQVVSLMKFPPESAGGIMEIDAFTLIEDFTVAKSVMLLQRLSPSKDIHRHIFVTDRHHHLVGYILLEDLVLHAPNERIADFTEPVEYCALVTDDRELIAQKMVHYNQMIVPVVSSDYRFLGVIPSDTLVNVVQEEASEDLQRMAALAPVKGAYADAPFWRVLWERSYILIVLLLAQSLSARIMYTFNTTLQMGSLMYFLTMLISAGGNSSNQTSAVVIQGLASGEIRPTNVWRFIQRELAMACMLALVLGVMGFVRAYVSTKSLLESVAISSSLAAIVFVAVLLGGSMPIVLKRCGLDPALSAGPFLATIMDILGVLIYCTVSAFILSRLGLLLS